MFLRKERERMQYERYDFTYMADDGLEYIFKSNGPNGEIDLIVQFTETRNPKVFNLSFGNLLANGDVDDMVKNKNQDRNKVLATVAMAAIDFLSKYPEIALTFSGSTKARTRLYRMAITANLESLREDFDLRGLTNYRDYKFIKIFSAGVNYDGFLIQKKL
ncbi:hypothetical protein HHL16_23670 [Pseudoflavitalea sp. G-6-1-2]|uniref:DUF6934 family protein n=1 Tax=Pseudoflavitalea sp. G-6-1-2 TaxID=2728841 RepID=UPI00146D29C5|nr:hypothetical protein [Pseudoflavitalea sp. G-6-1-2]NML23900.1 hypothetical protein [Pseudoflavitalea sp. G-6-1-2]